MIPVLTPSKEECCGCKACANACSRNAISFQPDKYGFEYPHIDAEKCIECGKCIKVCDFKKSEQEGVILHQPLEGYAARHIEKEVYANSTSGGVFSALAQWVIERGGVVLVVHIRMIGERFISKPIVWTSWFPCAALNTCNRILATLSNWLKADCKRVNGCYLPVRLVRWQVCMPA